MLTRKILDYELSLEKKFRVDVQFKMTNRKQIVVVLFLTRTLDIRILTHLIQNIFFMFIGINLMKTYLPYMFPRL